MTTKEILEEAGRKLKPFLPKTSATFSKIDSILEGKAYCVIEYLTEHHITSEVLSRDGYIVADLMFGRVLKKQ